MLAVRETLTNEMLKTIYYNPAHPAGFGGIGRLSKAASKKKPTVKMGRRGAHIHTTQASEEEGLSYETVQDKRCRLPMAGRLGGNDTMGKGE